MDSKKGSLLMQGHFIAQRYYVLGRLGSGSFGTVYAAQDRFTERYVAVKIPVSSREAHLFASLMLPQVPRCYGTLEYNGDLLLLMEWIRGETLTKYLLRRRRIEILELHQIMTQLCAIFQQLVEREPPILYPDLHPGNLMRESDGRLMLIDFGSATPIERSHVTCRSVRKLCYCLRTYLLDFLAENDLAREVYAWSRRQERLAYSGKTGSVRDFSQAWGCLMRELLPRGESASAAPAISLTR
jgi:serine/threonine protein kinase